MEPVPLKMSDPVDLCGTVTDMSGFVAIGVRGNCSFLDKATNASASNASGILVINNDSTLFHIAAGYATGASVTNDTGSGVQIPSSLPVVRAIRCTESLSRPLTYLTAPDDGQTDCPCILDAGPSGWAVDGANGPLKVPRWRK